MDREQFLINKRAELVKAFYGKVDEALMVLEGSYTYPELSPEEGKARAEKVMETFTAYVAKGCKGENPGACYECEFGAACRNGYKFVTGEAACYVAKSFTGNFHKLRPLLHVRDSGFAFTATHRLAELRAEIKRLEASAKKEKADAEARDKEIARLEGVINSMREKFAKVDTPTFPGPVIL